jgi:hypothetical protein
MLETKELRFYRKMVYGVERLYAMDEIKDEMYALTGKKTYDSHHIKALTNLGFTILIDNGKFEAEYI